MTMIFDASLWQSRHDAGERGDVTWLFQVVQPAKAASLPGVPAMPAWRARNPPRAGQRTVRVAARLVYHLLRRHEAAPR